MTDHLGTAEDGVIAFTAAIILGNARPRWGSYLALRTDGLFRRCWDNLKL